MNQPLKTICFALLTLVTVVTNAESSTIKRVSATKLQIEQALQPYKKLFDLTTTHLSPKSKKMAWSEVIQGMYDNAFEVGDPVYFLNHLPNGSKDNGFEGALSFSVESGDIESAEWYCQLMLQYHGVKKQFKYTSDEGVWHVLYMFNKWLEKNASHLTLLPINTYGGEYEALLVDASLKNDVLKEFKKLDIELDDMSPQGVH